MKIAVDAMGGDHAPAVVIAGVVAAARTRGTQVILVGVEDQVRTELAKHPGAAELPIEVVHASEVVEMAEHTMAVKAKKDSSMMVGMRLLREGRAQAFASAGNSGAVMAAALFVLGRIPCLVVDIGANADCKPEYLVQFAIMGDIYAKTMFGLAKPAVGIVSNGEEADKGSLLIRDTYPLLQASDLNFVGNVEGKDIGRGLANVVVTDGLTGNVVVKLTEGVVSFLAKFLKRELTAGILNKFALILMIPGLILALPGLVLLYPAARRIWKRVDWREVGGAPLLGVNGVVVIGHGRSDVKAIQSMIRMAEKSVQQDLVGAISVALARQEAGKS
jgi:glycerol-3-phosphate acyltransferase PlsX